MKKYWSSGKGERIKNESNDGGGKVKTYISVLYYYLVGALHWCMPKARRGEAVSGFGSSEEGLKQLLPLVWAMINLNNIIYLARWIFLAKILYLHLFIFSSVQLESHSKNIWAVWKEPNRLVFNNVLGDLRSWSKIDHP